MTSWLRPPPCRRLLKDSPRRRPASAGQPEALFDLFARHRLDGELLDDGGDRPFDRHVDEAIFRSGSEGMQALLQRSLFPLGPHTPGAIRVVQGFQMRPPRQVFGRKVVRFELLVIWRRSWAEVAPGRNQYHQKQDPNSGENGQNLWQADPRRLEFHF